MERERGLRQREQAYRAASTPGRLRLYDAVVGLALAVALIGAGWSYGGVEETTRWLQFYLCLGCFACVLLFPGESLPGSFQISRGYGSELLGRVVRLLLFPPFWLGLLLFTYVWVQSWNPEWKRISSTIEGHPVWQLTNEGLNPKPGWPTSIESTTHRGNWISFLQRYGAGWFVVCAVWIGVRRRETVGFLLVLLTTNALVYSMVTLAQEIEGVSKVLWTRPWGGVDFSGAFFYRNHGGAFLYLNLAVVLATYCGTRRTTGFRYFDETGFKIVVLLVAGVTVGAAVSSLSRAAWAATGVIIAVFLSLSVCSNRSIPPPHSRNRCPSCDPSSPDWSGCHCLQRQRRNARRAMGGACRDRGA